jgi:acetyl-CoA carboxylase alpha subunit
MANQKDIERLRLMKMAEKFGIPVLTLIRYLGAYPGLEGKNATR